MKKIIALVCLGFLFCETQAQEFSGGFRTGASKWMTKDGGNCFSNSIDGKNMSWDKEIFVRMVSPSNSKLVFEASMGHYALKNTYNGNDLNTFAPQQPQIVRIKERSQNLEWNLSAQYNLTCPMMQDKCPLMKKIKNYVGVVLTPTLSRNVTETDYVNNVTESTIKTSTTSRDEFSLWAGVTHTIVYNLCDHMYITSAARLQVDPNKLFDKSGSERSRAGRMGVQIGVGYNF